MARAAECSPPLDIVETAQGMEVILDLPGVPASSLDIVFADNLLVISGEKLPQEDSPFPRFQPVFLSPKIYVFMPGSCPRSGQIVSLKVVVPG